MVGMNGSIISVCVYSLNVLCDWTGTIFGYWQNGLHSFDFQCNKQYHLNAADRFLRLTILFETEHFCCCSRAFTLTQSNFKAVCFHFAANVILCFVDIYSVQWFSLHFGILLHLFSSYSWATKQKQRTIAKRTKHQTSSFLHHKQIEYKKLYMLFFHKQMTF